MSKNTHLGELDVPIPYYPIVLYTKNVDIMVSKISNMVSKRHPDTPLAKGLWSLITKNYSVYSVTFLLFSLSTITDAQFFIDPMKLLPLQRFLPRPAGAGRVQKRGGGGRGGGRGGRGGFGGRGGGGFRGE